MCVCSCCKLAMLKFYHRASFSDVSHQWSALVPRNPGCFLTITGPSIPVRVLQPSLSAQLLFSALKFQTCGFYVKTYMAANAADAFSTFYVLFFFLEEASSRIKLYFTHQKTDRKCKESDVNPALVFTSTVMGKN